MMILLTTFLIGLGITMLVPLIVLLIIIVQLMGWALGIALDVGIIALCAFITYKIIDEFF